MSQPVYFHECFIWPGTHEIIPDNILATPFLSVYLRLCILLVDNYSIPNGINRYHTIVRDMCYPFYQIIELASDALAVICHQLLMHGTAVNIDVQTSNDFRQRVVLCALDMAENPLYSGHTVRPINVLVECVASRPAILAVPAEPVDEEEDDDYEGEEEQEGEQEELEGEQEEQGGEQEEQGGDQEEEDDENDNQQELPAEALVTALVVDGVTCTICHDELEAGSMASRLPCFHFFHEPCQLSQSVVQISSLVNLVHQSSLLVQKDSDSDVEEENRTSNEFIVDLNVEYHERALLANQKRFYKRSGRMRIDELTKEKNDKGNGDKGKSDKGLVAESFDWDDESMSLEDEGTTKFKAFMAIVEDEPSVGKEDARFGQWVDITMKKVHRILSMTDNEERKHVIDFTHVDLLVNLENKSLKDEIFDHKEVIEKWTCSKVTLDQLLSEKIPGNIVKTLRGKGRRKENNSNEVLFTKADVSTFEFAPMITSDSEDDSNNQDSSLKTSKQKVWYGPCKHYGLKNHLSNDSYSRPKCYTYGSCSHTTTEHTEQTAIRKSKNKLKGNKGFLSSNQNPLKSRFTKGTDLCENVYARLPKEESGPKVVFGDNSSGDIEGYGSVNYNGITFTKVAYVNGMKYNLISISQLCDANFKVLFTKTQGTIFNEKDEVILIAPKRRDVYVINMSSYNTDSNACFYAKASPSVNWLDHLGNFNEKADDGFFLGYSLVVKAFRVFNIRRQEMEETFHVTFSEDNEAISQTSTEGDAINFNEVNSFPDDELSEPRTENTPCTDSSIPNIEDVVLALDEAVHPKPAATFESSNLQEDEKDKPIDD
uniref:Retrovirus-related Pol polyprotein from transposon TNT 1-94 n=1 Tax=Tanacetum cinerariifolium TaxID=118510 RepID=A0A6L2MYW9_TANCI|nr:retrovirus-related Pol polyprotein from transposon TNT 1-94 [Tanacetum cinerariifolium]